MAITNSLDAFIYNGEFELFKLRLSYLQDSVDQFVLISGSHTFMGQKKPVYDFSREKQFAESINTCLHIILVPFHTSLLWLFYKLFYRKRLHFFRSASEKAGSPQN